MCARQQRGGGEAARVVLVAGERGPGRKPFKKEESEEKKGLATRFIEIWAMVSIIAHTLLSLGAVAFRPSSFALPPHGHVGRVHHTRTSPSMIGNIGDSLKKAQDMMKNISPEKIKKAQEMSLKMQELQKELAATEIECKSADGKITVVYTGQSVPLSVKVDDEAMSSSSAELSESLSNALKQAFVNSRKHAEGRMMQLYEEAGLGDLLRMQQAQNQE